MARPLKPVFSREEINQLLKPMTAAVTHAVTATGSTQLRTHEADDLQALYLYEPFILALAQAAEPPSCVYSPDPYRSDSVCVQPSAALRELGGAWNGMDKALKDGSRQQQILRHLHPRLMAFHQAYESLMHSYGSHVTGYYQALPAPRADEFAQRYSEAFTTFQQQVRSPALAAEVNRLQKRSRRHAEGQRAYIDALLEQGPLVVTYLQLGYALISHARPLAMLKQDLHRLLHTHPGSPLRNETLLGFIWKLADGIERGYYSHLLLFHRADGAPDETALLGALQQCWIHDITQGAGACYRMTCSLRGRQNLLAHTRIDSRDAPDYRTLCDFIEYLNRLDQLYRLEAPKGTSIYGRSHLPGSQAGRSRRTSHDTLSHE